jgi:putative transposase
MRMVSELLAPHKAYCVVFIDDILIFSSTNEEHERHVQAVLDTLRKQGFRLKDKKCQFGRTESEFVGFKVDGEGIRLMEDKIKSIAEWPMIKSPKEARIFLGLTGAYRKFVPTFAIKAMPLFSLVNMSKAEFDRHMQDPAHVQEVEKSMAELKAVMASEPCLGLPEGNNSEFLLRTDASDFGIGATLRQKQKTSKSYEERVLAYFSRKLHGAETRYSTYDKELLAIRDALKHWRYYLLGRHTTISTDHASLRHMLSQPKLSQRQMRALEDMMEYDFDVEYLPGAKNYVQDALSRRPDYQEPPLPHIKKDTAAIHLPSEEELFELAIEDGKEWFQSIREGYLSDPYCSDVLAYLEPERHSSKERSPAEERKYKGDLRRQHSRGRHYHLDDGLIVHSISGCLVIPQVKDIKYRILREAHDAAVGGHFGIGRTYETISRRFFWPRMYQEVKRYVQGCATCARTKSSNQKPYGLLQPLDIPDERWRRINIDFITKLPTTANGNDTIITIIDVLTKRAHWIAAKEKDLTAVKFAEIFRDHYVRYHGLPDAIVSDRDVRFTSTFWKTLMGEFDTKLRMSTSFHPQTDGQAEKANSIVERYLRAYSAEHQDKWDHLLALAEFAYNATRQKSIEMSPFEADLSYIPRMPLDALASIASGRRRSMRTRSGNQFRTADSSSDGRTFAAEMVHTLSRLRETLQHAQEQQIAEANKHRQPHTFQQGDKVLLSAKNLPISYATAADNHRKALHQKYIGEFELGQRRGENAFEVLLPAHWKLARTQNVAMFKPSMIDHSRPQAPAPALRVSQGRRGADAQAEYGVEAIRSWRRNPDHGGRIEYEVKFEDDDELSWEPAEMFDGGGKEILEEFQAADEELKRQLAVETAKQEKARPGRPRKRRKRQAWVMEVEDGADITVFEAEDWEAEDWEAEDWED